MIMIEKETLFSWQINVIVVFMCKYACVSDGVSTEIRDIRASMSRK